MKVSKNKLVILKAVVVATFVAFTWQASAISLTIGDADYVGLINDGIPSNPSDEVDYINNLITLAPGASSTTIGTESYDRLSSTLAGPLPSAVLSGSAKDESGNDTIDATGYLYVLGKYDASQAGSLVWYLGDGFSGDVTLPSTLNGLGLSHISLYNPGTGVPDGGTSISLLGLSMLAFVGMRRRIAKA